MNETPDMPYYIRAAETRFKIIPVVEDDLKGLFRLVMNKNQLDLSITINTMTLRHMRDNINRMLNENTN